MYLFIDNFLIFTKLVDEKLYDITSNVLTILNEQAQGLTFTSEICSWE